LRNICAFGVCALAAGAIAAPSATAAGSVSAGDTRTEFCAGSPDQIIAGTGCYRYTQCAYTYAGGTVDYCLFTAQVTSSAQVIGLVGGQAWAGVRNATCGPKLKTCTASVSDHIPAGRLGLTECRGWNLIPTIYVITNHVTCKMTFTTYYFPL
jgi:hypothetical protein